VAINGWALLAAFGIGIATTVGCAWRWSLVAAGLGVRLPLWHAIGSYYRSQFLNTTLPGGVVGDVHRAVRHGADIGDVGLGVRAVVLERVAGQAIQVAFAVVVLTMFPSPLRRYMPGVAVALIATCFGLVLLGRVLTPARVRRIVADLRHGFAARRVVGRCGPIVHSGRSWLPDDVRGRGAHRGLDGTAATVGTTDDGGLDGHDPAGEHRGLGTA
jgi:uncharacterized membrane protein YbhN (UPF0104 family)